MAPAAGAGDRALGGGRGAPSARAISARDGSASAFGNARLLPGQAPDSRARPPSPQFGGDPRAHAAQLSELALRKRAGRAAARLAAPGNGAARAERRLAYRLLAQR